MKQEARAVAMRALTRVAPGTAGRLRQRRASQPGGVGGAHPQVRRRLAALEREVQELRQLNRRLADAMDVMTELLVPAMDRDDGRLKAALDRLNEE